MPVPSVIDKPEDLIQKCNGCDFCVFERILTDEQRKRKVLAEPVPQNHMHREMIEQMCGMYHDEEACWMKYAAMRVADMDDFTAAQWNAVIKRHIFRLGEQRREDQTFDEAWRDWTEVRDLGGDRRDCYADRFRKLWNVGLRKGNSNGQGQALKELMMYELSVAPREIYEMSMIPFRYLQTEHEEGKID